MTSYLSKLSPVPGFPEYTGPHKVGTIDVELPVSELESPSPAPDSSIPTVQYRIFYPCDPDAKGKSVNWIPAPQREYVSAYTRFLGAGSTLAEFISYFPRLLHYISIPVRKNGPLLQPATSDGRWPVMIFSHGLGGSRNAYSHLVGSIASHGVIVIAPEHRDGSTPISFIRNVPTNQKYEEIVPKKPKRTTEYMRISHTPSPEVEAGRNAQLKIRLWELGLIHDSIVKLDQGRDLTNLNSSSTSLSAFKDVMDVHTPGRITFSGHSFGAATVAQLVKSTFYAEHTKSGPASSERLFTPEAQSSLRAQITQNTPVMLLDMWCLPLRAVSTRWLWNLPMPCYTPGGPGGSSLLAIESQAFFKWRVHLKATKRFLSPDPTSDSYDYKNGQINEPNFFYATTAAHLSQSDFGMLFPWVVKRFLAVEDPERIMRLNVRAVMQVLRNNGIEVGATSHADMELEDSAATETKEDSLILAKKQNIRGWTWISTDVKDLGDVDDRDDADGVSAKGQADALPTTGSDLVEKRPGTAEML